MRCDLLPLPLDGARISYVLVKWHVQELLKGENAVFLFFTKTENSSECS